MDQLDAFQTNGSSPPRRRFAGYFPGETAPSQPQPDFLVSNHGTLFLLEPLTDDALAWVDEYLPADHSLWGSAVIVEHRYVADIVAGIQDDGLRVA